MNLGDIFDDVFLIRRYFFESQKSNFNVIYFKQNINNITSEKIFLFSSRNNNYFEQFPRNIFLKSEFDNLELDVDVSCDEFLLVGA